MPYLIFLILFLTSTLYFILTVSFRSFSRISLAGYLEDLAAIKKLKFDYLTHHELLTNALKSFSFVLQLSLFASAFTLLSRSVTELPFCFALLIVLFLVYFELFLYPLAYFFREKFLKKLLFLVLPAWGIFYLPNRIFGFFLQKQPTANSEDDDLSDREFEVFFEESTRAGVLEKEDKEMIESVIEFGDTMVKEIMTPRVDMAYVESDITLENLIRLINEKKKSRYPVISGRIDNIEGIILSKDVFNQLNAPDFDIRRILRPSFFIPETMQISELLKEMQKIKQKFAIVVDEFGGVSGVVTMEDIIEEIVGDIRDEYDDDTEQIVREKDYFLVSGDTDVMELAEVLGTKIEEDEDYQTVAGLISFKLGKIPAPGEKTVLNHFVFQVLEVKKNRIMKVKIYNEKSNIQQS